VGGAPAPEQVHLQFGADAATQIAVSWAAPAAAVRPRLRAGRADSGLGLDVPAEERVYTEALTGQTVYTYHARLGNLAPDTAFAYQVVHDGAEPVAGTFRTGPRGRSAAFRFTSFGDQSIPAPVGLGFGPAGLNAGYVVDAVDALDPLFHLMNGDLAYANVSDAPVETWKSFFTNNMRSARQRPWMPAPGNHENEVGNGPQGYLSYQTRFALPRNGSADFDGNWYKFQIGSVLFVMLDNNDVCYQLDTGTYLSTGDNQILTGYSGGAQEQWLEKTLHEASTDRSVDWIVVVMHQPAMSTSDAEGSDLGIRQNWMPLFYKYGVDFVLAGHDHDYERSYVVKGTDPGTILRPHVVSTELNSVDSDLGLVHLVIGTGGTKGHDDVYETGTAGEPEEGINVSGTEIETEDAPWSAVTDPNTTYPWGIGVFDVDPGGFPGDKTTMTFTYYHTSAWSGSGPYPTPAEFDTFTATRTRSDGFGWRRRSAK
jgi:hypothetical protein